MAVLFRVTWMAAVEHVSSTLFYLWFAFAVALSGQSEVGVHHVAWQWAA